MRYRKDRGVFVRSASTELSLTEHAALESYAKKSGRTIQQILRDSIQPIISPGSQQIPLYGEQFDQ